MFMSELKFICFLKVTLLIREKLSKPKYKHQLLGYPTGEAEWKFFVLLAILILGEERRCVLSPL